MTKRDAIIEKLYEYSAKNEKAKMILDHYDAFPKGLQILAGNNPDALAFVAGYLDHPGNDPTPGESHPFKRPFPHYLQWDKRWGYNPLGDDMIATGGCGPTSLAMILSGLATDPGITPATIAVEAMDAGLYGEYGLSWLFIREVGDKYGFRVEEIPFEDRVLKKHLREGRPILASMSEGDFTTTGHFLVFVGLTPDGNYIINDANSVETSKLSWPHDRLTPQVKKSWVFYR